jgi:hypothetical protein
LFEGIANHFDARDVTNPSGKESNDTIWKEDRKSSNYVATRRPLLLYFECRSCASKKIWNKSQGSSSLNAKVFHSNLTRT